jgi:hypothetical protein
MLVTVEFADAGVKTGTHRVLVVGGCSDMAAPADIGMSLEEEAKTLLSALQWEFVAAQAAEITERARQCKRCGARLNIKDWARRSVHTLFGRVLLRSPRLVSCPCEGSASPISPLKGWLARTSQELRRLFGRPTIYGLVPNRPESYCCPAELSPTIFKTLFLASYQLMLKLSIGT